MKVKRLMASVSAGFDDFVTRVENHEAVADCAIDELRKAAARVRVQQARTATQLKRIEGDLGKLEAEAERWRARALRVADGAVPATVGGESGGAERADEAKAIECVRRARRAELEIASLAEQRDRYRALAEELQGRLRDLERRLADAQLKRTALSSRAARARTLRGVERCGPEESLEAVFDRWDTVVTADEYRDGVEPVDGADLVDALDREFADEEDLAELRGDLAALRARARSEDGDEGGAER